jgi:hypothetical protein
VDEQALAAGAPSPEQKAADAVAAYLGTGKIEVTASEAPADVKKEQPVASADQPVPPATAEPYQLDVPEGIPSDTDTEGNRAILAGFSEAASSAGMSRSDAETLVDLYIEAQSVFHYGEPGVFDQNDETYTPSDAARVLQRYWKDDYATNLAAVRKTVHGLGPKFVEWLDASGMGNSPAAILALSQLGNLKMSKAQAQEELRAMTSDKTSDYHIPDSGSPKRQAAVQRARILGRVAYTE